MSARRHSRHVLGSSLVAAISPPDLAANGKACEKRDAASRENTSVGEKPSGIRLAAFDLWLLTYGFWLMAQRLRLTANAWFGGGVWKSNPPPVPRRNASPALKAGKVTGPLSPPQQHSITAVSRSLSAISRQ